MAKKGGKYAACLVGTPKWPGADDDPDFVTALNQVKRDILEPFDLTNEEEARKAELTLEQVKAGIEETIKRMDSLMGKAAEGLRLVAKGRRHAARYAAGYAEVRKLQAIINRYSSNAELLQEAYTQLFVDQAENEGITSITLDSGRGVSYTLEPYPSVVDKAAFRRWCIEDGLEESLSLHPSTTKALVKKRRLDGLPDPDGVTVFNKPQMRLGGDAE